MAKTKKAVLRQRSARELDLALEAEAARRQELAVEESDLDLRLTSAVTSRDDADTE